MKYLKNWYEFDDIEDYINYRKKALIDLLSDIATLFKINKIQSNIKFCVFVENNFIYQYLKPYIEKKKNNNTIIVSFEKLKIQKEKKKVFVLKTMFLGVYFF